MCILPFLHTPFWFKVSFFIVIPVIPGHCHTWFTQYGEFQIRKNQTLSTRSYARKKILLFTPGIIFYLLQISWISNMTGQQRMTILENRNWLRQLRANFNLILSYSNASTEWKKRLIQNSVKFELVLPQIPDLFLIFNMY